LRRRTAVIVLAVLALLATGCDLRFLSIPGDGPTRYRDDVFAEVTVTPNLIYGTAVDQLGNTVTLRLDVYQPTDDTVDARPAIVWVHGGSFRSGSRTSGEIVDQARTFAEKGYVSVAISYRLHPTGCTVVDVYCITAIHQAKYDAQAAVRWLRANATSYGIDTGRIAMGGSSAGAITALNVAYGAADTEAGGSNPGHPSTIVAAVSLSGAKILDEPDPGEPAALLFHGTADTVVPYAWAEATVDAAVAAGTHTEMTAWDGAGHVPYSAHRTEIIDQTTNFLYHSMTLAAAAS
jgi:acetyl esterase/lipase